MSEPGSALGAPRPEPSAARRVAIGAALGVLSALVFKDLGLHNLISFWGSRSFIVTASLAAGAFIGWTRLRPVLWVLAAAMVTLWMAVAWTPLTGALASGLTRRDPLTAADAVVVLGSNIQVDGDLSAAAQDRLLRAVEIVREGLAPRIVITDWGTHPSHPDAVRAVLARLRVDVELVVVPGVVSDTHDEALGVARLVAERGWRELLLVTSPLHTRRAAATFAAAGLVVRAVPAVETSYDIDNLDRADERIRAFGPVVHERVGTMVYRWRGWLK